MMMGGGATRQTDGLLSLVQLLTDPEAAAKTVTEHKKAIEAHVKAKREAEATMVELQVKQSEHDERETMVSAREQAVKIKAEQLDKFSSDLDKRQSEINMVLAGLQAQRTAAQKYYEDTIRAAEKDSEAIRSKAYSDADGMDRRAKDKELAAEAKLAHAFEVERKANKLAAEVADRSHALLNKEHGHRAKVAELHELLRKHL